MNFVSAWKGPAILWEFRLESDSYSGNGAARIWVRHLLLPDQEGLEPKDLLVGVLTACHSQQMKRGEAEAVAEAAREASERLHAAQQKTNAFREAIFAALQAAKEPDPFASIRGDFDLSAHDSREWKTSLHLPSAEKCGLLKAPSPAPASLSTWAFACVFRSLEVGYEDMVKSVQSALSLPYQPDERAVNMNRVFFAENPNSSWRLFVAKINEATVGVSIVAVRPTGVAAAAPVEVLFPRVSAMPSTELTIGEEVEAVKVGIHNPFPRIESTGSTPSPNGMGVFEIKNATPYNLTALFSGPIARRVEVAPGSSVSIDLPQGSYKLVGRVDAPNVLPSYGEYVFEASKAGVEFYLR